MSTLTVTLIDVGWGDSILLEWRDAAAERFALIDSNDSANERSSLIFLKKYFSRKGILGAKPIFDFVLLTHWHADHGDGLRLAMTEFGTRSFWYPKSNSMGGLANLLSFAQKSTNVTHHQSIDETKVLPDFGDVHLDVLWPLHNQSDDLNENNNSVVLLLSHENVQIVLAGDAEEDVWSHVAAGLPNGLQAFKVPHHGSPNGTFSGAATPWLDRCDAAGVLAISAHGVRYGHPDPAVVQTFENRGFAVRRTDREYHIALTSDGNAMAAVYSH